MVEERILSPSRHTHLWLVGAARIPSRKHDRKVLRLFERERERGSVNNVIVHPMAEHVCRCLSSCTH